MLREQLRLTRIAKYGPASEKLNDAQLSLLEGEPGVSSEEVLAEAARGALPEAPPAVQPQGGGRKHPGRQTFSADLPRVERVISAKQEDCGCKTCGAETKVIGFDESEQLDVEPARYFVLVSRREKWVCGRCDRRSSAAQPKGSFIERPRAQTHRNKQ